MTTDNPTTAIPSSYLYRFEQLLAERGINIDQLLLEAGVPISMSAIDDEILEVELEQVEALLCVAIEHSGESELGFYLGNRMPVTTHGILGYAAMSGQNLGESVETIVRYYKTINQLMRLSLYEEDGIAVLQLDDNYRFSSGHKFFHEVVMGAINCMFNVVTDHGFNYSEVRFSYAEPENVSRYEALFDCSVIFNSPTTQLRFPVSQLATPLVFADKNAHAMAAQQCEDKLAALSQGEDPVNRVRSILLENKGHYPSADEVAEHLNVTQRTLRRWLAKADTSFSELLGEVRRLHALEYIQNSQLKVCEIAYLLGYSDPNNFGRAFKRWTDMTPAEYRETSRS